MQVFCFETRNFEWISAARRVCLLKAIAAEEWQLRHSRESLAFSLAHSFLASSSRASRNSCLVSIVPKILPQTSFEACILRAILSVQSCGTWQSGQLARTPERFVKCGVRCSSWNTLLRISWHEVQNFSVLVTSSAVLKAPQNRTPQTKPPNARKPRLRCVLGRLAMRQNQIRSDLSRCIAPSHFFSGPTRSMSLNVLGTSGCASVCWTWQAVQK